jgi:hypothetical protein
MLKILETGVLASIVVLEINSWSVLRLKKDGKKKGENGLSTDTREGKTVDIYTKKREGKLHADCQSRSRVFLPSPPCQFGGMQG